MWHFLKRLMPAFLGTTLAVLNLSISAAPFAYVTNFNSDSVSVIDTASNTVVATVLVPASDWPNSVAVNPDGTRVYITSGKFPGGNIGRVSVIDTATNAVIATVEVGDYQGEIALNPAGTRAYVSYTGTCCPNVSVIDTASNTVVATVPLAIPDQRGQVVYPAGVAVNPAGTRVYVSQGYVDSQGASVGAIYVIDTASNTVVDALVMGSPMGYMVFNHAGTRAYVTRPWEPSVSVIDTSTNTIVGTIPVVGGYPVFVAIAPDDTRLYVSNINDGLNPSVSVIDLTSNTVVATILVGGVPYGVAVNSAGTFAYVPVPDQNYVAVIDTRTNTVVGTVAVGTSPSSIAIGPPEWAPPPPPLPQINVVSPSSGPAGTAVSLYGMKFGVSQGTSVVKFDATQATVNSWSDTKIDVIAPAGLSGPVTITVTTTAGTSSGVTYIYPPPPAFLLNPTALHFGSVTVGTTSAKLTVTLTDSGGPGLSVTSVAIQGANAADFTLSGNTCRGAIPVTGCSFDVYFAPLDSTPRSAQIVLSSNAAISTGKVDLDGTGIAAAPNAVPGSAAVDYCATLPLFSRLFNGSTCTLISLLRQPEFFGISKADISDEQLFNFIKANQNKIQALVDYVGLGYRVQDYINGSARKVEGTKTFSDAVMSAGETLVQILSPFTGLLVEGGTAAAYVLDVTGGVFTVLGYFQTYDDLARAVTGAHRKQSLQEYLEDRCGFNGSTCAPNAATVELARTTLFVDERPLTDEIICASHLFLCKDGKADDTWVQRLFEWYETQYEAYRLVHYGDSQSIRHELGQVVIVRAAKNIP